jgi:hypothetical protein
MTLDEFLAGIRTQVLADVADSESGHAYEENSFTEIVMRHMADIGMTYEPQVCHYAAKVGPANLRLSGFALSDDSESIDLFVSLYEGVDRVTTVPTSDVRTAAEQCVRFVGRCAEGRLAATMDESNDAYLLASNIEQTYASSLDEIRIFVLTDRVCLTKSFQPREIAGKVVKLEVMDIERLHRHWSEGKPRDELVVNFVEVAGAPLPCVAITGEADDYDYVLTAIPGETLRTIYEQYGPRLLEANVRSFLSATGKVNRGIRDTLRASPERFLAYNNGIVLVADEAEFVRGDDGIPGLSWLKGMQIVNGGQTTASIYFTKRRNADVDLRKVRVPAKIVLLRAQNAAAEEVLIADISRYANSQNVVKQSDLSANKPYHVELEKLAETTYCPDGRGKWFYERTAGSYNTMLAREGTTPAKLRQLRQTIPTSRKITKTDLAKYLNVWDGRPDLVSFGSQKNFEAFMKSLADKEARGELELPDLATFKRIVAKAIVFRTTQRIVRPRFQAFQANIANYVVALLAHRLGDRIDLDRIWQQQEISGRMQSLILDWSDRVNAALHRHARARMVSEAAKKPECWEDVNAEAFPLPTQPVPELR